MYKITSTNPQWTFVLLLNFCCSKKQSQIHYIAKSIWTHDHHTFMFFLNPIPDLVLVCFYNMFHTSRKAFYSVFQFIPKVISEIEVRALCEFFHFNLGIQCHGHAVTGLTPLVWIITSCITTNAVNMKKGPIWVWWSGIHKCLALNCR